jgi:hypothetical protein
VVVIDVDNDSVREEENETALQDALPSNAKRSLLVRTSYTTQHQITLMSHSNSITRDGTAHHGNTTVTPL